MRARRALGRWRASAQVRLGCGALVGGGYGPDGTSATPEGGKHIHIIRKQAALALH